MKYIVMELLALILVMLLLEYLLTKIRYSQALHMLAQPQMLTRGDSIRGRLRWVPREMQAREIEGAEGVRPAVAASVAFDTA